MTSARQIETRLVKDLERLASRKRKGSSSTPASEGSKGLGRFFVLLVLATLGTFIWWASRSELEQMVMAQGQVIPDSSTQVIQSLEGGIVTELLVKEGDAVRKDQVLLRLHDVQFSAKYQEDDSRRKSLEARLVRLQAEADGAAEIRFPEELVQKRPDLVKSEQQLFTSRMKDFHTLIRFNQEKLARKKEKLQLLMPVILSGALSDIQRIDLESEILEIEGLLETTKTGFVRKAMEQLDEDKARLETLVESMRSAEDQLARTTIKSPLDGVVNKIYADTTGRVIQGGQPIMEIVPDSGGLLVEARIRPSDIGFLKQGIPVKVRFTAYDFTMYGGLEGTVETLGVNTISDREGEVYYPVKVRTQGRSLGHDRLTGEEMDIRPGMVAEVDILTGSRTVMDYLLNPIHRARRLALRER